MGKCAALYTHKQQVPIHLTLQCILFSLSYPAVFPVRFMPSPTIETKIIGYGRFSHTKTCIHQQQERRRLSVSIPSRSVTYRIQSTQLLSFHCIKVSPQYGKRCQTHADNRITCILQKRPTISQRPSMDTESQTNECLKILCELHFGCALFPSCMLCVYD